MSPYGTLPPYTEDANLLGPRPKSKRFKIMTTIALLLFASTTFQNLAWYYSSDNPAHRDRVRRGWEVEQKHREERIEREDTQRAHQIATEEARRKERLAREDDQRREERENQDAARREKIRREDAKRELVFQHRTTELDARQRTIDNKEREMQEEKDRRERAALVWAHLTMHERCLEYGTRQYHAELLNIPQWEDAHRWCMETPIKINGLQHDRPDYCNIEGSDSNRQAIAYWTVRSHEPTCQTGWDKLRDKGCGLHGSRQRLFEAMLWNHQAPWDNWREMCSTTPIRFDDHVFDQPISCDHRGRNGIWGTWAVHDDSC